MIMIQRSYRSMISGAIAVMRATIPVRGALIATRKKRTAQQISDAPISVSGLDSLQGDLSPETPAQFFAPEPCTRHQSGPPKRPVLMHRREF